MVPVSVSPIPKVFCRIKGIILSYNCQNDEMDKKASPKKKVLFVLSFKVAPPMIVFRKIIPYFSSLIY